jgi:L-alanine-DL-glutamate epimerase-like enolase superfamily enzyme
MTINKIEAYKLTLPTKPIVVAYAKYSEAKFVIVKTYADGIVGWGEATGSAGFSGETQESLLGAFSVIAPRVVGLDPFDIGRAHDAMGDTIGNNAIKAAIDESIYDIMGKKTGLPVHKLIGGLQHKKIATQRAVTIKSPEEMAKDTAAFVGEGFKIFEVKVGLEPQRDVERVKAVREAAGDDVVLIVDANQGWTPTQAIRVLNKIERYDVLAEQPTRGIMKLAEVRKAVNMPIIADESIYTAEDAIQIIRADAADIVSIKLLKCGGFYKAKQIAAVAESNGMPYRVDDMLVTKLSNTASLQLAASCRDIIGCGFLQHRMLAEEKNLVSRGGLSVDRGEVIVPDGDGLGVEIDEKLLGKPVAIFTASQP